MKGALIAVVVIVLILLIGGGTYVSARNNMVSLNEGVNSAYSAVDVEQQRRLDLIPNLVASVKGYVAEESTILTNIANARAGVIAAGSNTRALSRRTSNWMWRSAHCSGCRSSIRT